MMASVTGTTGTWWRRSCAKTRGGIKLLSFRQWSHYGQKLDCRMQRHNTTIYSVYYSEVLLAIKSHENVAKDTPSLAS